MLASILHDGPVVFLEHKLLADYWLDYMGSGGRENLKFDVPEEGAKGSVPDHWEPLPFGKAAIKKNGTDLTIVSVGVGVHRSLEAATLLTDKNISAEVIDLRTVWPLDAVAIVESVSKTGHLLVVDEDYKRFGLSGEIAALVLEHSIPIKYGRVCTNDTIPYSHSLEIEAIPGTKRIVETALSILS